MIYVMSDLHGCYDLYIKMLEKISFCEEDTMYILGDVVDRGKDGMKILLDIATKKNIICLRGNHDQQAAILLSNLYRLEEENCPKALVEVYKMWLSDGGNATLMEYLKLSETEQKTAISILRTAALSKNIVVNGTEYLLAHTVPEVERLEDYEKWEVEEYTLGEPDYEELYFVDKYIITGHTPTGLIDKNFKGKIWRGNNHIAIDCGAVFTGTLGCLCLDTMEEFYVK